MTLRRRIVYSDPKVGELARDVDDDLRRLRAQLAAVETELAALVPQAVAAITALLATTETVELSYDETVPEIRADVLDDAITNARLANVPEGTIKGRNSSGTGNPEDLDESEVTAMLDVVVGDSGAGGVKGLVPAPAAGDAAADKVLHADGTWQTPAGGALDVWMADAPPLSPHAMNDEFNGSSLDSQWTVMDPAGTLTETVGDGHLQLFSASHSPDSLTGIWQPYPGTTEWAIVARANIQRIRNTGGCHACIFYGAGSASSPHTTTLYTFGFVQDGAAGYATIQVLALSDYDSVSSTPLNLALGGYTAHMYLRLRANGATMSFDISSDGRTWTQVYTGLLNSPVVVGLGIIGGTTDLLALFDYFRVFSGTGTSGYYATKIGRQV